MKEEAYPILQCSELYLPKRAIRSPNSQIFNRLMLNLREYTRIFENFDMIATYRPYHFNGEDFGLYIYAEMFSMLVLSILQRTSMGLRDSHTLALDSILTHGAFHYLIERYATFSEDTSVEAPYIYPNYKRNIYSQVWGTADCLEETLANALILRAHPSWSIIQRTYIEFLIHRQRNGYRQSLEVSNENIQAITDSLEMQIIGRNRAKSEGSLHSSIWYKSRNIPRLTEYIEANIPFRLFGLPVYLVNDCKGVDDFERIVEMLFPLL